MNREVHAPFWERLEIRFLQPTQYQLHWVPDVSFRDDQSRIRNGHAPLNIAMIKKTVLNVLRLMKKQHPPPEFEMHAQTCRRESRLHECRKCG